MSVVAAQLARCMRVDVAAAAAAAAAGADMLRR